MVKTARDRHWDEVYSSKRAEEVSWFQREPVQSLELLALDGCLPASVVDVGAGESLLVDRLLARGVSDVTLLDVSTEAVARTLDRLGRPESVRAIVADVTTWRPDRTFVAWHDRAVLHFLVGAADRAAYVRVASEAVAPGGLAVIGVFASDGPESCSGLPVQRFDQPSLVSLFEGSFELVHSADEHHVTPWGGEQHFLWVALRRR